MHMCVLIPILWLSLVPTECYTKTINVIQIIYTMLQHKINFPMTAHTTVSIFQQTIMH